MKKSENKKKKVFFIFDWRSATLMSSLGLSNHILLGIPLPLYFHLHCLPSYIVVLSSQGSRVGVGMNRSARGGKKCKAL